MRFVFFLAQGPGKGGAPLIFLRSVWFFLFFFILLKFTFNNKKKIHAHRFRSDAKN